jgi:glycosyltransferase involved in cell wall biosynthesis
VKSNFVDLEETNGEHSGNPLFVGRLSQEKGIVTLVNAVNITRSITVDVVGTGPLDDLVKNRKGINYHGWQDISNIYKYMNNAAYLVMPSIWYENFPRTLVEAFACGLPVIASRLGAMEELIEDRHTGLLFDPGSENDLSKKLIWAKENPEEMLKMGRNARIEYESKYTSEINYNQLISIYNEALSATEN